MIWPQQFHTPPAPQQTEVEAAVGKLLDAVYAICRGCQEFGAGSVNASGMHVGPDGQRCIMPNGVQQALWRYEAAKRVKPTPQPEAPPALEAWAEGSLIERLCEVIIWMSGSADFSPEGVAGGAWPSARAVLFEALDLTQSQPCEHDQTMIDTILALEAELAVARAAVLYEGDRAEAAIALHVRGEEAGE